MRVVGRMVDRIPTDGNDLAVVNYGGANGHVPRLERKRGLSKGSKHEFTLRVQRCWFHAA
jgi:hypothetical protein